MEAPTPQHLQEILGPFSVNDRFTSNDGLRKLTIFNVEGPSFNSQLGHTQGPIVYLTLEQPNPEYSDDNAEKIAKIELLINDEIRKLSEHLRCDLDAIKSPGIIKPSPTITDTLKLSPVEFHKSIQDFTLETVH
jgi:hypothetical protein